MAIDQLKSRLYALIGEITTEFNNLEALWYLIFTCLLSGPRPAVDAVFLQHKTGGGQRKMITDIALAMLERIEAREPPPEYVRGKPVFERIVNLCKETNQLAGRRNHVMHSLIFVYDRPIMGEDGLLAKETRVHASGIGPKPSALANTDVEAGLRALLADIEYHALDVERLRLDAINWVRPADPAWIGQKSERNLERLRQEVAERHPRTPPEDRPTGPAHTPPLPPPSEG